MHYVLVNLKFWLRNPWRWRRSTWD